jgi:hypothetical protein
MSRALQVLALSGWGLISLLVPGCGSESDPGGSAGSSSGAAAGTGNPATAGTTANGGGGAAGSPGNAGNAGAAGNGSTAGSGSSGSSSGGNGAGGSGVDCATVTDECPMATGLELACKQRFALGINYAWRNFGADFGGLAAWSLQGVSAGSAGYAADLSAMKAAGASLIRWWVFPDFRGDGVTFDASDDPTGLSATALADMAKALELAQQADVYLVPTIFSFDAFRPKMTTEGVTVRSITGLVTTPARRAKLMANVVRPLAHAAAMSPHAARLAGWDIVNEPEWAIEPSGQNSQDFTPNEELDAVSLADMKALISEAASVLKEETPGAFRSVGWAAAKWSWAFNDLELDVNQPHIYGWVNQYWPYTKTPAELGYPADRPTIMGEFFLQAMPFSDGNNNDSLGTILESWWSNGYAGAWPWQHFDQAANLPLLKAFADAKGCEAKF